VSGWAPGHPVSQLANGLRRTLVAGAADLPADTRALFAGFVLGDDRGRSALVTDDFRGAGLTHLLAVSGQNVAFVLALLEPLLRRLALRPRLAATLGALAFFALLTRFEPSVLRATMMAAIATLATTWGREASSLRILALAVAALVLIDPLLVGSVGFQLSVAASLGIVVLAPGLREHLPGPAPLRLAIAVAVAAQVGAAPVLLMTFGGLPVVSLPANLLAAPAAGPVTVWGLTAGLVAGLVPSTAPLLHLPTRLLVGWVAAVARHAVAVPLGQLDALLLAAAVLAGALAVHQRVRGRRRTSALAAVVLLGLLLVPAVRLRTGDPITSEQVVADADLWRSGPHAMVVLGGRVREGDLLEALRERGVTRLETIVCRSSAGALRPVVADLRRRFGGVTVIAPRAAPIDGAVVPVTGSSLVLGDLTVWFEVAEEDVSVEVVATVGEGERSV
jgi:ComEC/Rec2-related protein